MQSRSWKLHVATVFYSQTIKKKKNLPLGNQGLNDLLKGMPSRFSQPVKVCELLTFLLTTCLAPPEANTALDISDSIRPMFLLRA